MYPFKKVISKELRDDLFKFFLNPGNKPDRSRPRGVNKIISNIDSKIISNKHVELISKWIKTADTSEKSSNSYEFKLLLRGSHDGFTPEKFHEICDKQACTVSIIKVKHSDEILGGYNPIEWKSDCSYGITKDSFIFSFKNEEDIGDYILSRVNNEKHAINNWFDHGPSFGSDLSTFSSGGYYKKWDYEKRVRETDGKFPVEDYETFQIIQK